MSTSAVRNDQVGQQHTDFGESLWIQSIRRLRRNPGAMLGLAVLVFLILVAIFAPWISPYDPTAVSPSEAYGAPSASHWLGTDQFGRDLFSRIIWGSRISLSVGFVAVGIAATLGIVLGLIGGYYGGRIDAVVVMLVDLMMGFPGILLAMVIVAVLGPGLYNVMIAVGLSSVPRYIRIVRGSTLALREEVYVEAAEVIGCPDASILFRHILPNILAPLTVVSTLGIAGAILTGASLSFLGLGAQPPTPEWGALLSTGRQYLRAAWWISAFPGVAIMITVLAVNLLGDGLRDALDPRLKI